MAHDDDEDRWVAHRREGWTVETDHGHDPISVHETFEHARSALHTGENGDEDADRADDG
jgi:hypothetical protein